MNFRFFFSSRRRHTRFDCDWSSDVCSSDLNSATQVQQNFAAGGGERYYLLFNVSSLTGVLQSFIMMEGSQYDSYSYLFRKPRFISLDPNAAPANIPISGIRIGVNGTIARVGQSYARANA